MFEDVVLKSVTMEPVFRGNRARVKHWLRQHSDISEFEVMVTQTMDFVPATQYLALENN